MPTTPHVLQLGVLLGLSLAGCSGSDSPPDPAPGETMPDAAGPVADAPAPMPDAVAGTAASVVPCEGATVAGDIWYYDGVGYVGSALNAELPAGAVVQFHDMGDHTADHTNGLFSVSGSTPTCVRFDGVGRYELRCYFHAAEVGAISIVGAGSCTSC